MYLLDKFNSRVSQVFSWIAGGALVAIMLLAVGNMFLRAFYVPFGATWEVIAFLAAIVTALALGYAQIQKVHVSIDLLVQRFPPRLRALLESITYLLSVILFATASWHIYLYAVRLQERGALSETLRLPYYPFTYAVAAGFLCFTLVLLADFIKSLTGVVKQ